MDISTEVLLESTDTATTIPYGITEEELVGMVDQAENEGGLDQHESDLIRNAIEFNDLEVSEIPHPPRGSGGCT